MTAIQKIIKYLAIAFAIFLTISIISTIIGVIAGFAGITAIFNYANNNSEDNFEISDITFDNEDVRYLDIDIALSRLTIKEGDSLKAETNNKYVKCTRRKPKT